MAHRIRLRRPWSREVHDGDGEAVISTVDAPDDSPIPLESEPRGLQLTYRRRFNQPPQWSTEPAGQTSVMLQISDWRGDLVGVWLNDLDLFCHGGVLEDADLRSFQAEIADRWQAHNELTVITRVAGDAETATRWLGEVKLLIQSA